MPDTSDATSNLLGTAEASQLARIAVKPPPFWRKDPALWFLQLDAQFKLGSVKTDETMFYTAVSALDAEVLQSVRDIVLNPPATDKYPALKQKLIATFTDSENVKLKQLLQDLQLGDMRPTQLLGKMRDLSAGNFQDNVLKSLWMSRLPSNTQAILAASSEPLPKLAELADKIHELVAPAHIQEVQSTPSASISELQSQINALSQQVASLAANLQPRHNRSRSKNRYRYHRDPSKKRNHVPPQDICYYHRNFGAEARKCSPPCSFVSGN